MNIKDQLIRHEGLRLDLYKDSVGKLTIGVGRNIDDIGISKDEAMYLLDNDIKKVEEQVSHFFWYKDLSEARKKVIIDMVFNLGLTRFKGFKKTIAYIAAGNFDLASIEMLSSRWADQVGSRAHTLSNIMKDDIDIND